MLSFCLFVCLFVCLFCRFWLVSPGSYIVTVIPTLNKFHKQTNKQIPSSPHPSSLLRICSLGPDPSFAYPLHISIRFLAPPLPPPICTCLFAHHPLTVFTCVCFPSPFPSSLRIHLPTPCSPPTPMLAHFFYLNTFSFPLFLPLVLLHYFHAFTHPPAHPFLLCLPNPPHSLYLHTFTFPPPCSPPPHSPPLCFTLHTFAYLLVVLNPP